MIRSTFASLAFALLATTAHATPAETARWQRQAAAVLVTRDDWGIAHVHGHSDADAVFGMIYAQAEDDFNRIEANYLTALGRTAEAEGEAAIWGDLRQRLYVDPAVLQRQYKAGPPWLRALMDAWADGLNYYLARHPEVHPKVLTRFEPWMALSFSEGSIGGDIEKIDPAELARFYGETAPKVAVAEPGDHDPRGSNGIAIAPQNTANGRALLLINPHTSHYFRAEQQVSSDAGLNAYGASTWGQFFIYQGWNADTGWMHTSTGADNVDEFAEDVVDQGGRKFTRHGAALEPLAAVPVTLRYRKPDGTLASRSFTTWRSIHGPIVRAEGGKWIATSLMWKPVEALEQSFLRTRQTDLASYLKVAERKANSSNNTLFADRKGEIAYLHPQFMPRRSDRFDYTRPVDGSDPAADWQGLLALDALPRALNPKSGWVYNSNNAPWGAAGPDSPKRDAFPRTMDLFGENDRGRHATMLLANRHDFTAEGLREAAFDSYLPFFARALPGLLVAYDALPPADPRRAALTDQIALLRGWNFCWSAGSEATSLAVFWADTLATGLRPRLQDREIPDAIVATVTSDAKLAALATAAARLTRDFGSARVAWGSINRFQRLDDSIRPHFDDARPSLPVPFTWALWGTLASSSAKAWPGTKKWYGSSGNSFVAVIEFGPRVEAWAITAGGESGDPASPHFADQAQRFVSGQLRKVYFWPDELAGHVERKYYPGD
ncbi:penicillin acylase family protein [Novosphingobium sp.]|uniref:penicillin acylase family protein n=1 Tax=Novosphingobium sp. TaxID=1874826 RepID=UPI0025E6001E|nr:penicillin acylase family protein [Novosphingobium sp.]